MRRREGKLFLRRTARKFIIICISVVNHARDKIIFVLFYFHCAVSVFKCYSVNMCDCHV